MIHTETATQKQDNDIILNNTAIQIARRLVLIGFSSIIVLFLPRYLGDVGLGQLSFAQSVAALFATTLSLGLGRYMIKETARNLNFVNTNLSVSLGIRVVMSLVVIGIIFGIVSIAGDSWDAHNVMYIAAATAIALSFSRLMTSVMHGMENLGQPAIVEVFSRMLVLLVGIPVLVMGLGVMAYAGVLLMAAVVSFGLNAYLVSKRFRLRIAFNPQIVKSLVIGGAPFILMGVVLDVYGQIDTIILRIFTDDAVVGWYAAANNIYKTIDLIPLAITAALLPTLSRVHVSNPNASAAIARKIILLVTVAIVPMGLGISLFSSNIIDLLPYPDSFQNSIPLLTILALTIPLTAVLLVIGTVAMAVDKQKPWAIGMLVTAILNIVLNVIAAPYFQEHYGNGGIGVAITTLISEILMIIVGVLILPRPILDKNMAASMLKIGFAATGMVVTIILVRNLNLGMVPEIFIGAVTYSALVLVFRTIATEDYRFAREFVESKLKLSRFTRSR